MGIYDDACMNTAHKSRIMHSLHLVEKTKNNDKRIIS